MHYDLWSVILRFVVSFVTVQIAAVAGCMIAFKKHRSVKAWLVVLGAALYLNLAYLFMFNPVGIEPQIRAAIDYALIYPFFAYMLVCLVLAPLFAALAAGVGLVRVALVSFRRQAALPLGPVFSGRRREFLKMLTAGVALPVAAPSLYGMYVGRDRMRIDRVALDFPDLPPGLDGFTIAQISDLHVGPFMDSAELQEMVGRINAMTPDLVAVTGDIINWGSSYVDEAAAGLSGLQARYGVYGVLGNHDFYCDTARLCRRLEKSGVRMLRNEWREVRTGSGGLLQVVGIDDPRVRRKKLRHAPYLHKALRNIPGEGFKLLLSHRPGAFDDAAAAGIHLTLAGHTHAGQIIAPAGNGRNWSFARLFYERDYGLYDKDGSYLYINRGLGVVGPPMRINCPREITRLVLRRRERRV